MNREAYSAHEPGIFCFASELVFLASLVNLILPDNGNRSLGAVGNGRVNGGVTFLIVVFAPLFWIAAKDEAIRAGERSVDLHAIEKMLESHLPGYSCCIAVEFFHRGAVQQRFK